MFEIPLLPFFQVTYYARAHARARKNKVEKKVVNVSIAQGMAEFETIGFDMNGLRLLIAVLILEKLIFDKILFHFKT